MPREGVRYVVTIFFEASTSLTKLTVHDRLISQTSYPPLCVSDILTESHSNPVPFGGGTRGIHPKNSTIIARANESINSFFGDLQKPDFFSLPFWDATPHDRLSIVS